MIINRANLQILETGFQAAFSEGFGQAPTDHEEIMLDVSSTTLEEEYGWLGQWPGLEEWVGEATFRGVMSHGYTIRNRRYQAGVDVDRDAIEDDRYGIYTPMMREAGRSAAAHPATLIYEALRSGFAQTCYDGQFFFDTDHPIPGSGRTYANRPATLGTGSYWFLLDTSRALKPIIFQRRRDYTPRMNADEMGEPLWRRNRLEWQVDARVACGYGLWQLAYGSRADLDADSYAAARQAMLDVVGDQDRPLGCMPTLLVVAPDREGAARRLLVSELTTGGMTNEWAGSARHLVTPWLTVR